MKRRMSQARARSNGPGFTLRIGISSCLLGQEVRFDGGHKRDPFLTDTLGPQVEWVPVCPEVEMGLGTPRETLRLVRSGDPRARCGWSRRGHVIDHTDGDEPMGARGDSRSWPGEDLCGYVLKKDSPSCGMERVKTYGAGGMPERNGRGLFAAALMRRFPSLPVEEEGRLNDPRLRENFIERVFAYRRLKDLFRPAGGRSAISCGFTPRTRWRCSRTRRRATTSLGRLVARGSEMSQARTARRATSTAFMATLADRRDAAPAHERADAHDGSPETTTRSRVEARAAAGDRGVSHRHRAAGGAADAAAPPRPGAWRRLPGRADLPRAPSARADAQKQRLRPDLSTSSGSAGARSKSERGATGLR